MARANVQIDSGPISATDRLRNVPREKWRSLMLARRDFMAVKMSFDCRCLVEFVNDAKLMFEELGFATVNDMIREGYELKSDEVEIAVRWLELNPPKEPVSFDVALSLGSHGGDRRSERAKDQGDNVTLKDRGNAADYTLARLKRDRPDLAEKVISGELSANAAAINAGFRKKLSKFEQIARWLPSLTTDEIVMLRQMLDEIDA